MDDKKFVTDVGLDETSFRLLTFGKYKGRTVASVIRDDPQYICWVDANVSFFPITDAENEVAHHRRQSLEELDDDEHGISSSFFFDEGWK